MTTAPSHDCRYLLGAVIFCCMTLGGGTMRGQPADSLLLIAIITAATCTMVRLWSRPGFRPGQLLFVLLLCAGIAQIIPVPASLVQAFRPQIFVPGSSGLGGMDQWSTISLSASRTISALATALCAIYLFLAMHKIGRDAAVSLIPFYLAGLLVNCLVVFLNYSCGGGCNIVSLLGHDAASGLFENQNHLSALFCASIPLVAYVISSYRRRYCSILLMLFLLIALLAIGSEAGILLGLAVLVLALVPALWRTRTGTILAVGLTLTVAVYGYGAFVRIGAEEGGATLERRDFVFTSLRAISANWRLGTGYGTFDLIYPHYEMLEDVYSAYVNHAHNDFLEIVLEGGVIGALLVLLYLAVLLCHLLKQGDKPLQQLSFLSICVLLAHSTVDYPLRTMAILVPFAFFNALFFSRDNALAPSWNDHQERAGNADRTGPAAFSAAVNLSAGVEGTPHSGGLELTNRRRVP
ncbi:O-antigen ligase family protein [uncultured Hoeflea sp.]|uniref:O-antigen ligase family protein n=1 Tax=uncultured Hoeflea sp. TaxID=538666 RepID=UPI0030DD072E